VSAGGGLVVLATSCSSVGRVALVSSPVVASGPEVAVPWHEGDCGNRAQSMRPLPPEGLSQPTNATARSAVHEDWPIPLIGGDGIEATTELSIVASPEQRAKRGAF